MIHEPVFIVGAPRSGTSLMQKIIREHPDFLSQPDEYDIIWNHFCHPRLKNWDSDFMDENDIQPGHIEKIHNMFGQYSCSSHLWKVIDYRLKYISLGDILRSNFLRNPSKMIYKKYFPFLSHFIKSSKKRIVNKSVHHCFRLKYLINIFPDAKFVYTVRNGIYNVNSLINGWDNKKNQTYDVPLNLNIKGLNIYNNWCFTLPPGWKNYIKRNLEEVCAFQWVASHDIILKHICEDNFRERVLKIDLEGLSSHPEWYLQQLADFLQLSYAPYFESVAKRLPVVNPTDRTITTANQQKNKIQHPGLIKEIIPMIEEMMQRLGYDPPKKYL